MKKLLSFFAIIGIILASNCSRIPENNDPVIGIWAKTEIQVENSDSSRQNTIRKEWIFNDAYLGRYQKYNNNSSEVVTDFKWSIEDGVYTIVYPDVNLNKDDAIVEMQVTSEKSILKSMDGSVLAVRE